MSKRPNKKSAPSSPAHAGGLKSDPVHEKIYREEKEGVEVDEHHNSHWLLDKLYWVCVVVPILPAILSLLYFSSALHGTFVYDDIKCIVQNPFVTGPLSLSGIFTHDFWGMPLLDEQSHKSFRPNTTLFFWTIHALFGLSPRAFHLASMAVQALNAILVARLAAWVFGGLVENSSSAKATPAAATPTNPTHPSLRGRAAAVFAVLLFAVHPMHTEAVSNVTNLAELLSLFFQLSAFLFYVHTLLSPQTASRPLRRMGSFAFVIALCAAAMGCKESGVMVLAIIAVVELLLSGLLAAIAARLFQLARPLPRAASRLSLDTNALARFVAVAAAAAVLLFIRLKHQGGQPTWYTPSNPAALAPSFLSRFLTFAYTDWIHFSLLLLPVRYCPDWRNEIDVIDSPTDERIGIVALFLVALTAVVTWIVSLLARRSPRAPAAVASLAWLVLPFLPAANIFFYVGFVVAERVTYAPSVGFCLLSGLLLSWLFLKSRRLVLFAFVCLSVLLAAGLIHRDGQWSSEEALWASATRSCPRNFVSHVLLGMVYDKQGRLDESIKCFENAIEQHPHYMHAHINLGRARHMKRDLVGARQSLETALLSCDYQPDCATIYSGLGVVAQDQGDWRAAAAYYRRAHQADPSNPRHLAAADQAQSIAATMGDTPTRAQPTAATETLSTAEHLQKAQQYLDAGKSDQAERHFLAVAKDDAAPDSMKVHAYRQLAALRHEAGDHRRAVKHARRAVTLAPDNIDVNLLLGAVLSGASQHEEAAKAYRETTARFPMSAQAHYELGVVLNTLGAAADAAKAYEQAVATPQTNDNKPNQAKALVNLGVFAYQAGNHATAESMFEQALARDPTHALARSNLAALRGQTT
eukprot:m.17485 g.17485  ORF g.17485 m.17485 type:complete len:865 (-) comp7147_c0_seq1:106-2700(-)